MGKQWKQCQTLFWGAPKVMTNLDSLPQKTLHTLLVLSFVLFFLFYFPFGILLKVEKDEDSKLIFFFVTVNIF